MNEKTMVADALVGINGELKMFGEMIPQTENKELKQCLKQIRNSCEMSQEKLYESRTPEKLLCPCCKGNGTRSKSCQIHSDPTDNALIFFSRLPCRITTPKPERRLSVSETSPILTYIQFFSKISNFSYNPKNSLLS